MRSSNCRTRRTSSRVVCLFVFEVGFIYTINYALFPDMENTYSTWQTLANKSFHVGRLTCRMEACVRVGSDATVRRHECFSPESSVRMYEQSVKVWLPRCCEDRDYSRGILGRYTEHVASSASHASLKLPDYRELAAANV